MPVARLVVQGTFRGGGNVESPRLSSLAQRPERTPGIQPGGRSVQYGGMFHLGDTHEVLPTFGFHIVIFQKGAFHPLVALSF